MSSSVRVARRGHGVRLVCAGAALGLLGAVLLAGLLVVTFTATQNLAVAASNRPNPSDGWRQAGRTLEMSRRAPARGDVIASDFAVLNRRDDLFKSAEAAEGGRETLRARLAEASLAADEPILDVPVAPIETAREPAPPETTLAEAPRVISPDEPVQLASLTPPIEAVQVTPPEDAPPLIAEAPRPEAPVEPEIAEPVRVVPIPTPRPADFARMAQSARARRVPVSLETAAPDAPATKPSRPTALAYAAPELETRSEGPNDFFRKLLDQDNALRLPERRSGIAVYDIASATVRLPNGERLEAHSGLGHRQDNPAYVREKNHGPTPPNVYDLRMREALFHGAAAIRLLPRDQKKVFNRDGLLAHPYMYAGGGSRSQSNGCVVFKDYGRFLRAFKAGEIARLVVVPSMAELRTYMAGL